MATLNKKVKYFFFTSFFLVSCTSTNNLINSEQIYIGMSVSDICTVGLDAFTASWDDPCYGEKEYNSDTKSIIMFPSNKSIFFVFRNVNSKNSKRGNLSLITYSYTEAVFFNNNIIE